MLYFCVCPKLARCPCVCRGLEAPLHILPPPPSLTSDGVSYFLIFHSLWPAPFRQWALLDCWLFFLQPTLLLLFADLLPFPTVPPCHSCCDVYLTQASWASLGLLLILLSMTQYDHWAFYYIACRLLCPIYFL